MLYRIWSRSRKHFAVEWCDAKVGFWDDAVRGSSPLQAALRRLVADELTQHTEHQEACTGLFDAESFYESISLSSVARAVLLGMALLTYAGVRFLTAGCSGFSEGIVISNGVAAGCAQRNHAARLVLYDILQKSHELHPSTTTAQWVDDLAQRTQSPPSEELVRDLQEDMLAVASKSQVIATTPSIAKQVVSTLARHDKDIQEASRAKDLGAGCVQCKKANASNHGQVMGQGGETNEKMREVCQLDLKASQCTAMENGSMGAESLWNGGCGAPPTWIKQARTRAAEAARCGGRGRCLTTTITPLHPNADPAIQISCNLIRQWLIFWEHNHRIRR